MGPKKAPPTKTTTTTKTTTVKTTTTAKTTTTDKKAATTDNKGPTTVKKGTTTAKQTKGKEEKKEETKQQVVTKVNEPTYYQEIPLTAIETTIEAVKNKDKMCTFIVDPDNNAFTFYKYKGELIDLNEYGMKEHLNQAPRSESQEKARKKLYLGLKSGSTCVFYMENAAVNLTDFFKETKFWQPETLFNPDKVLVEEWHKANILTEEEDVDFEGNKGNFIPKKEFTIIVLLGGVDIENLTTLFKELNVDHKLFKIVKIKKND